MWFEGQLKKTRRTGPSPARAPDNEDALNTTLKDLRWPEFGLAAQPPDWRASRHRYAARIDAARARMRDAGLTHLLVYGDREHFANLQWLTGLDPRFEEALCIVGLDGDPLLLLGNECVNYFPASPAPVRVERYQFFSLPDMPRDTSRPLAEILKSEGLDAHSRAGLAGWKTYTNPRELDAPSYIADAVRFACGWENVENAAAFFIDPRNGLRTTATAHEIAFFEWTNTLASEGMKRVIAAIRPGALDYDLLEQVRYNGVPLGCHMTLKCGNNRVSLASARGERVVRGGRFSCGIAYWGANVCRCGWVAEDERDLPDEARGYVDNFAAPYFDAMAEWFSRLQIGAPGAALHDAIHARLPQDTFHVFLNAGHLIGFDEWVASPVWDGSDVPLRSGMVMQADVIPSHPGYYSSRMEDAYVLADAALQSELRNSFPDMIQRCERRRDWMRESLGLEISADVLPLSNLCGWVAPYLLRPDRVLARA